MILSETERGERLKDVAITSDDSVLPEPVPVEQPISADVEAQTNAKRKKRTRNCENQSECDSGNKRAGTDDDNDCNISNLTNVSYPSDIVDETIKEYNQQMDVIFRTLEEARQRKQKRQGRKTNHQTAIGQEISKIGTANVTKKLMLDTNCFDFI